MHRGSHHGAAKASKVIQKNVVIAGTARAEDFCMAAVYFTVVSLILQNNPDQMSHMCPPVLGTCLKSHAATPVWTCCFCHRALLSIQQSTAAAGRLFDNNTRSLFALFLWLSLMPAHLAVIMVNMMIAC